MSIRAEVERLERRYEDLEQARTVAVNESTGRAGEIREEMAVVRAHIEALAPFKESLEPSVSPMPACTGCGRAFWPESLTDGRCEFCGPLGGEGLSESIQTGDLKRRRAPKR